jgi:hypothetical protein
LATCLGGLLGTSLREDRELSLIGLVLLSTVVCVFLHLKCDFQSPYILDSCFPSSLLSSSARVLSPGPHLPEAACAADFGHSKRNDNSRKVYTLVMTSWWCDTLLATSSSNNSLLPLNSTRLALTYNILESRGSEMELGLQSSA